MLGRHDIRAPAKPLQHLVHIMDHAVSKREFGR
jgi:hypothetical protein